MPPNIATQVVEKAAYQLHEGHHRGNKRASAANQDRLSSRRLLFRLKDGRAMVQDQLPTVLRPLEDIGGHHLSKHALNPNETVNILKT